MEVSTGVTMGATQLWSAFETTAGVPWDNESLIWILVVGFVVAFILSFAVGANDVANSFGTTVGAKVLTLKQACILATIFETGGALLLGAKVGETIRKGITDVTMYDDIENGAELLMLGELCAMFGSAIWQLVATVFKLPVSGTHSIVGSCIGFSLVAVGTVGINWTKLGLIVASWFISPVISGLMAIALFVFIDHLVLRRENPLKTGLLLLPVFYGLTIGINFFSIMFSGAPLLGFDNLPIWAIVVISLASILLTGLLVQFLAVPRIRRRAKQKKAEAMELEQGHMVSKVDGTRHCDSGYDTPCDKNTSANESAIATSLVNERDDLPADKTDDFRVSSESLGKGSMKSTDLSTPVDEDPWKHDNSRTELIKHDVSEVELNKKNKKGKKDKKAKKDEEEKKEKGDDDDEEEEEELEAPEVQELFSSLQVLTACFASFAHGGNDVSNAIGPLIALWIVFWSGEVVQKAFTPWYLLVYGGLGICVGLWLLGRRVIETIGSNLTKVTPSRGFCIELMTAITVLIASNVGLPVSTTHCKVGAVVSIGWWRSREAVDWSLARNIGVAWFVTVPVSGLISAGAMWFLMQVAL